MEKKLIRKVHLLALFLLASVGIILMQNQTALAATKVQVASVEYYDDNIIVRNNGNEKISFATEIEASKGNWETVTADKGEFTMIDISWMSPTVENILMVKGEDDPTNTKSRVIIKERPTKLEVKINYTNIDKLADDVTIAPLVNIMATAGTGSNPINFDDLEWRKGTNGQWQSTRSLTVGILEKLLVKGTYIYFRIRAVDDHVDVSRAGVPIKINDNWINGISGGMMAYTDDTLAFGTNYPDGLKGRRFSNEVKVKITRKSPPMVYGIDGEKFTADIKYGKEYRVTVNGVTSEWKQVIDRTTKYIPLESIVNDKSNGTIDPFPEMTIEIRDYATSKSASSKITEIILEEQRTLDASLIKSGKAPANAVEDGDKNIYIDYNGNKNMILTIPTASMYQPYEYTVVKKNNSFDLQRAAWTSVTKGTEVKILASKAVDGGTLYVRKKEILSKAATRSSDAITYALASTYVTSPINYPSTPVIQRETYTFTKGYSSSITFDVVLNEAGKNPFENSVKSIKLGTKEIGHKFTITNSSTTPVVKTMHITLEASSLNALTNCYNKAISIYFDNGTVDKTSVRLTIQSATSAPLLTATIGKGTNTGTTSFTVVGSKALGNTWSYVVTNEAIPGVNKEDKITNVTAVTPAGFTTATVDNITATDKQFITIFETDADGFIVKFKCITMEANYIR